VLSKLYKSQKSSSRFLRANRVASPFFKSCKRIPVHSSTNRKKMKNRKKNLANKKKDQPTGALAGFENSNEIQKAI